MRRWLGLAVVLAGCGQVVRPPNNEEIIRLTKLREAARLKAERLVDEWGVIRGVQRSPEKKP